MQDNGNPSRRTKAPGKPGIYYREVREDGRSRRRYEFTYLDSDGRRRWQTVPGLDNLDEAEAQLLAVKVKLRSGERVAPSKRTFDALADEWFAQLQVADTTKALYESNLRIHLRPRFGSRKAQDLKVDDVANLIVKLQRDGKAGWSQRSVLVTLSSMYSWSVRRGMVPVNPVRQLERAERPKVAKKVQCIFERDEMARLIEAAPKNYRPVIATALFSGLRLMELLGLRWQDVDFDGGYLHVRNQLGRDGALKPLKTEASSRDVVIFPELASLLRRHKAASKFSQPHHHVFTGSEGTPMHWRNVEHRGFDKALTTAKLDTGRDRKPVLHDCRHTFASMLIAGGMDVTFVSRQLGHSSPAITLGIYSHLYDKATHADRMRQALSQGFGSILDGNAMETTGRNESQPETAEVLLLSQVSG
jgi:integrase